MRFFKKNWLLILTTIYIIVYSPFALIGFGFGGFNIFNISETYSYCIKGDEICRYRFELYIYTACFCYIVYRFFTSEIMIGRKPTDEKAVSAHHEEASDGSDTK